MKLQVSKAELAASIKKNELIKQSSTVEVLQNYLVEIKEGKIYITSTDLEFTITTETQTQNGLFDELSFLIDRKSLVKVVNAIKIGYIDLYIDSEKIIFKSNNSKHELPIVTDETELSSYPKITFDNCSNTVNFTSLIKDIRMASLFVGHDEMRPTFSGINVVFTNDSTVIQSTDANVLYQKTIPYQNDFNDSIIIPNSKLLNLDFEKFGIIYNDDKNPIKAIIIGENFTAQIRLIDGRFPNVNAVIPKNYKNIVPVENKSLVSSISELNVIDKDIMTMVFGDNKIILLSEDIDYNKKTYNMIFAENSVVELDFNMSFNKNKFSGCLKALDNNIFLKFSEPNRPMIMQDDDESKIVLCMPMMANFDYSFNELFSELNDDVKEKVIAQIVEPPLGEESEDVDFSKLGEVLVGDDLDL